MISTSQCIRSISLLLLCGIDFLLLGNCLLSFELFLQFSQFIIEIILINIAGIVSIEHLIHIIRFVFHLIHLIPDVIEFVDIEVFHDVFLLFDHILHGLALCLWMLVPSQ